MKSFLEEAQGGITTPGLRYAFTNITTEDFVSHWNKVPISIKAGETIEVSDATPLPGTGMGQTLAIKMTGELVDRIIIGSAKLDEVSYYKNNPGAALNSYRSPKPTSLMVPAARKEYEDQILKQLSVDEESPAMQAMRQQVMDSIQAGTENPGEQVGLPNNPEEFASVKNGSERVSEKPKEIKPAKTKKI